MCSYVTNICDRLLAGLRGRGKRAFMDAPAYCHCQQDTIVWAFPLWLYMFAWDFAAYGEGLVRAARWRQGAPHGCASHSRQILPQKGGNLLAGSRCATKVQQAFVLNRELLRTRIAQGYAKGCVTLELRHGKAVVLHGTAHEGNSPGAVVRKAELFHLFCDHGIAWCRQRASQIVQTKTALQAARVAYLQSVLIHDEAYRHVQAIDAVVPVYQRIQNSFPNSPDWVFCPLLSRTGSLIRESFGTHVAHNKGHGPLEYLRQGAFDAAAIEKPDIARPKNTHFPPWNNNGSETKSGKEALGIEAKEQLGSKRWNTVPGQAKELAKLFVRKRVGERPVLSHLRKKGGQVAQRAHVCAGHRSEFTFVLGVPRTFA